MGSGNSHKGYNGKVGTAVEMYGMGAVGMYILIDDCVTMGCPANHGNLPREGVNTIGKDGAVNTTDVDVVSTHLYVPAGVLTAPIQTFNPDGYRLPYNNVAFGCESIANLPGPRPREVSDRQ